MYFKNIKLYNSKTNDKTTSYIYFINQLESGNTIEKFEVIIIYIYTNYKNKTKQKKKI